MSYAALTVDDPNPVKRWLQRRRFAEALRVLRGVKAAEDRPLRVLDYGAGDGEFLRRAHGLRPMTAWLYEPTPELMAQAHAKLADRPDVRFAAAVEELPADGFDFVVCLEVIEHLPPEQTAEALATIARCLAPDAQALFGVPHELHLPALVKGLFRIFRRRGDFDARAGNILRATWGRPPRPRPAVEISPGLAYHPHHLGFDHRELAARLAEQFTVQRRWFSPWPWLGPLLNSEVYFVARVKEAPS